MNLSSNYAYDALKLIETGTAPNFQWIYAENSELKDTDANYYSVNYSSWMNQALTLYKTINTAIGGCQNATITAHTELQSNVFETAFSNGTKVYVNYNSTPIQADGMTIASMGYKTIKAGE